MYDGFSEKICKLQDAKGTDIKMENFLVSLRAVFPMFVIMSIGYLIRRKGMVDEYSLKKMNSVCFKVFMAAMMFKNVYFLDMGTSFKPDLMLFAVIAMAAVILTTFVLVLRVEKENRKRGVMIQAMFRSNFVVLGMPIVASVYGDAGIGVPTMLISVTIPFYNVFAVLVLSYFGGERPSIRHLAKDVLLNPYIVSAACGFTLLGLGIKLPEMVEGVVRDMAGVANPLAILILGASFSFQNVRKYVKELVFCISFRLAIFPGIVLGVAMALGFQGVELLTLVALFATPTAIASHVMAQQFGGDADLAGVEVVISTALSLLTLFLWVFGLKSFGMLPAL